MWADPLATAAAVDGDQLGVTAVCGRGRSKFLRTQRGAGVASVLTRTELTTIGLELLAVFVRLSQHHARLRISSCDARIHR